jgi:hypothetical protein
MTWTTKKTVTFPQEHVRHISWGSFWPELDAWGRLVITKDFKTGAITVEVQGEDEGGGEHGMR